MPVAAIKSLEKGIDLILMFSERRPALSLPEISSALGLPESTAYRLIVTLQKKHILTRDLSSRKYALAPTLLGIQPAILAHLNVGKLALPHLEQLAADSGETAILYLLQGQQIVLTESVSSSKTVRFVPAKGTIMPLHAPAGGRAILAFLSDDFLARYLEEHRLESITESTVTQPGLFRRLMRQIRRRGFSITTNQFHPDTTGVAAPIFDHTGQVIGSLTVAGPNGRFTTDKAGRFASIVCKHSAELSKTLGTACQFSKPSRAEAV